MRHCLLLIFACALLEVPIIKSEEGTVLSEESRQDAFVTFKDKGGATDIAIHLPFTQCPMRALIFLATLACCMTTAAAACRDKDPSCDDWASKGECEKNAGFMNGSCPVACKQCTPPELVGPERLRGIRATSTAHPDRLI